MGSALLVSSGFHSASCLQLRMGRKVTGGRLSEILKRLKNCRTPKPSVTFSNKYLFWVGADLPTPPALRHFRVLMDANAFLNLHVFALSLLCFDGKFSANDLISIFI